MLTLILLVLALICFIWAAAGNQGIPVQLGWLGAALVTITLLLARGGT